MTTLTASQREVLEQLADAYPAGMRTSAQTGAGAVSGRTATSLERRMLVSRQADDNVRILAAGLDALGLAATAANWEPADNPPLPSPGDLEATRGADWPITVEYLTALRNLVAAGADGVRFDHLPRSVRSKLDALGYIQRPFTSRPLVVVLTLDGIVRADELGVTNPPAPPTQGDTPMPTTAAPTAPDGTAWSGATALDVHVDRLYSGPDVRTPGGPADDVDELAKSIEVHGIIEPLIVRHPQAGDTIEGTVLDDTPDVVTGPDADLAALVVIAGRRRLAAARQLGLTSVPCLLRTDLTDTAGLEVTLIENLQRAELTPIEEARGYGMLRDLGLKQTEIAKRVGVNQGTVSKRLQLLGLDTTAQALVDDGRIAVADAVELAKLDDTVQARVANIITKGGQNAEHPDRLIKTAKATEAEKASKANLIAELNKAGVPMVTPPSNWKHKGQFAALAATVEDSDRHDGGKFWRPQSGAYDHQLGAPPASPMTVADHAIESCHAAILHKGYGDGQYRWEPFYVCTEPSVHGWTAPADKAAAATAAQDKAAKAAARQADRAKAASQKLHDARLAAARQALKTDKRAAANLIADVAAHDLVSLTFELDTYWIEDDPDARDLLLEVLGLDRPAQLAKADDSDVDEDDVAELEVNLILDAIDKQGGARVALAGLLARGEHGMAAWGSGWRDADARDVPYLRRLVELGGYEPTKDEAKLLAQADAPPPPPPAEYSDPMPDDTPDHALAWYHGTSDDDPGRWVDDQDELDAMIDEVGAKRAPDLFTIVGDSTATQATDTHAIDDQVAADEAAFELDELTATAAAARQARAATVTAAADALADGATIDEVAAILDDQGLLCQGGGELALCPADGDRPGKPSPAGGITHCAVCGHTMRADEDGNVPDHVELEECPATGRPAPPDATEGDRVPCPAGHGGKVRVDDDIRIARHPVDGAPTLTLYDVDVQLGEAPVVITAQGDVDGEDVPLTGVAYEGEQVDAAGAPLAPPAGDVDEIVGLYRDALASVRGLLDASEDAEAFEALDVDDVRHRTAVAAKIAGLGALTPDLPLVDLLEVLAAAADVLEGRMTQLEADAAHGAAEAPQAAPAPSEKATKGETCPGTAQVLTDDRGAPLGVVDAECPQCGKSVRTTTKGRIRPHKRPAA